MKKVLVVACAFAGILTFANAQAATIAPLSMTMWSEHPLTQSLMAKAHANKENCARLYNYKNFEQFMRSNAPIENVRGIGLCIRKRDLELGIHFEVH